MRTGGYIQVRSGIRFWPTDPDPDGIDVRDIAYALSNQARFSGHARGGYTVAEHSVRVSYHCDRADALWGLLHDSSEAYLVDVPTPVKHDPAMGPYRRFETRVSMAVCEKFGLDCEMPESVRRADHEALATEARDLMPPNADIWRDSIAGVDPWPEKIRFVWPRWYARLRFRLRFWRLTKSRNSGTTTLCSRRNFGN